MTPEQAGLVRKAQQGLEAAKLLAREGYCDVAAGRSYAAMFQVAEALLLDEGLAFARPAAVITAFGERFARTGRVPADYHRYLLDAYDEERLVDYDIAREIRREEALEQMSRAERFLTLATKRLGPLHPAR